MNQCRLIQYSRCKLNVFIRIIILFQPFSFGQVVKETKKFRCQLMLSSWETLVMNELQSLLFTQ